MAKFIHNAQDIITVDDVSFSLAFFLTQEGAYALPADATTQYYDDSIPTRIASNGVNQVLFSDAPWATGDGYISNKATYQTAFVDSIDYPDVATAKITKRAEVETFATTKKAGNVTYGGNTFTSHAGSDAHHYFDRYTRTPAIPGGFYLRDITDTERVLGLADLKAIADLIDDLHRLAEENMHNHWDSIDALGTINDVKTYDFSGGWPTIPHT
ncbi:hypothetical protein LCGC14_1760330 [marine sediment metagenome]|uniref:DUF4376 domain-containing protein n=1 Tax=marine sediment metagenome TaxID=412755 RepID=A0A0F9H198_9ZZZZ